MKAYVYRCEHKKSKKFYIGYREANKVPASEDLGIFYFTSSPVVSKNFENYTYEILAEYESGKIAFAVEQRLIYELRNDPLIINKHVKAAKKLIPVNKDIESWEGRNHKKRIRKLLSNNKVTKGIKLLLWIQQLDDESEKQKIESKNKLVLGLTKEYLAVKGIDIKDPNFVSIINELEI